MFCKKANLKTFTKFPGKHLFKGGRERVHREQMG